MTMLLKKLKVSVLVILAATLLGAGGTLFPGAGGPEARAADGAKPRNELDALRHENELLKLNLNVVLEKVHAQEAELQTLKGRNGPFLFGIRSDQGSGLGGGGGAGGVGGLGAVGRDRVRTTINLATPATTDSSTGSSSASGTSTSSISNTATEITVTPTFLRDDVYVLTTPKLLQNVEDAMARLRGARDESARQRAVQELEKALSLLKASRAPTTQPAKAP